MVHQENKAWASKNIVPLVAVSSFVVVVAVMLYAVYSSHVNFALHFNPFALLSFGAMVVNVTMICLVLSRKSYNSTNNWYILFVLGATLMAAGEGLQRSSIYPGGAIFWQNFSFLGLALLPPAFYLFIIAYTSSNKERLEILSSITIFTWGIIAFLAGTGLFYLSSKGQIHHTPWGYMSTQAHAQTIAIIWFILFYILGTGLLFQFRKSTQSRLIKKQVDLFMLSFLLPFGVAIITSLILPAVYPNVIPPLATFIGTISAIIVYRGIRQYHMFTVDPQIISQNVLDTMSEGVIIVRLDKTIESINNEAARLLGVAPDKAESLKLQSFFANIDWKEVSEKITVNRTDRTDQLISRSVVNSIDHRSTPVRITVTSLIANGEKIANILVLSDISELTKSYDILQHNAVQINAQNEVLKQLETQLREEKASVEHVVEIRTKELVNAQNKLKAADQLKTEFIMLTSHNLRTPLAIAEGYAELISGHDDPANEAKYIMSLRSGLKRLGELVEDLITINSIEAGDRIRLNEVPLNTVITPLIQEITDLAAAKNDKFVVNLDSQSTIVNADIPRLQGALRNLLNNACKFTDNGTVELHTTKSGNVLRIDISDTGIGIDQAEIPKLFSGFHTATNVLNSNYNGRGIGLYLAQLIIEEHGGKISVVSQLKRGTTFTVELPCH